MPIDTRHPEYEAALPDWKRNRAVVQGERAVKLAGPAYLPRLSGQGIKYDAAAGQVDEYEAYKDRAAFFPATSRTLDGLKGLIFRKDPQRALPAILEAYAEDIDMRGLSLDEFAQKVTDDIMQAPHGGILVEFPQTTGEEVTAASADALGWRPYAAFYAAESVINWRTGRVNNRTVITEIRLAESAEEADPADPYQTKAVPQIRLLRLNEAGLYEVAIFQQRKAEAGGKEEWREVARFVPAFRGKPETAIPFVFVGPRDTSPEVQKAPLTDIAGVNISHYRNSADYENGAHWTGCPTPIFIGDFVTQDDLPVTEVKLGSASGIQMTQGSDAKFLEFQGQGLDTLKTAMADKEAQMAVLGARILSADKKQAEAAETAAIHRAGENSVLASLAGSVSKALEAALRIMTRWSGAEGAEISYRLNTDYQPANMTPQDLAEMVKAWQAGALSEPELFEALVAGEVIRDDKTFDDHKLETEAESEEREAKAAADAERALEQATAGGTGDEL